MSEKDLKCPACPCLFYSAASRLRHIEAAHPKIPVEKSLAQIAESLKPVGEFFEALRDGRVFLNRHTQTGDFRIDVISPKEESK